MKQYRVVSMMTGTSMDGVDLAYCIIEENNGAYTYKIEIADCVPFPQKWKLRLQSLVLQNAVTYLKTDVFFGHYLGEVARNFIEEKQLAGKIDFIASHGQTVFHQPENQMTSQIGDGAAIAAETGYPVVCNFRTTDVALNGQGTPIAPVGDKLLYGGFKFCLNLGGISNLSVKLDDGRMLGWDVSGCNMVLNMLANEIDLEVDKDGLIAREGKVHDELLNDLNTQWYYEKAYPKSLGGGWVTKVFMPMFRKFRMSNEDKLCTAVEHIAMQIGKDLNTVMEKENIVKDGGHQMLVTGGGAFNKFLIERIKAHSPVQLVVPDAATIKFKEALIIALMGVLRVRGEMNVLASATGATGDSCGGEVFQGTKQMISVS